MFLILSATRVTIPWLKQPICFYSELFLLHAGVTTFIEYIQCLWHQGCKMMVWEASSLFHFLWELAKHSACRQPGYVTTQWLKQPICFCSPWWWSNSCGTRQDKCFRYMYSHLLYMKSCIWPMSLSLARNTLLSVQSIISLCLYLLMNCLLLNLSIYHISKKFSLYFMSWKVCLVHTLQPSSVFMHT